MLASVLALLALTVGVPQEGEPQPQPQEPQTQAVEPQQVETPSAASRRARALEWVARPDFLARTILGAAVELDPSVLRSHLAECLRGAENPSAIRVAVHVMPEELAKAHTEGFWKPSLDATRALLAEIEVEGLEHDSEKLLQSIFAGATELRPLAGRLLWRACGELSWSWFTDTLVAADPAERLRLIEATGARGDRAFVPQLAELLQTRDDLGLGAAGLVALARLGHEASKKALDELVRLDAGPRRATLLEALAPAAGALELQPYVKEALRREDLTPAERLALQSGQVRAGNMGARTAVRAAYVADPSGPNGLALARALAREPEAVDAEVFLTSFPRDGDAEAFELNVLIARTLLHLRHPWTAPLLHAALWSADWNVAVLAGGLIARNAGMQALIDELEAAPPATGESERRRVGFALGEWGGLGVVEELSRTRSEGDPVLQGALLGALAGRAEEEASRAGVKPAKPKLLPTEPPAEGAAGAKGAKGHPEAKHRKRKRPGG